MTTQGAPACSTRPGAFDTTEMAIHFAVRGMCLACEYRDLCRDVAKDPASKATGTFGGDLFKDGRMIAALGVDLT